MRKFGRFGAASALLLVTSGLSAASCAGSDTSAQGTEPVEGASHAEDASDYLSVNRDGTLALRPGALEQIPANERAQALSTLDNLNDDIARGRVPPFATFGDARLDAEVVSGQALGTICYCSEKATCCLELMHMCCESGFWKLCWKYGTC